MDFVFSRAKAGDAPAVLALYKRLVGTPGCTWDDEYPDLAIVESDIQKQSLYLLREAGKGLVGAAFAGPSDELDHLPFGLQTPCDLARVGVLPEKQRRGAATFLVKKIISEAQRRGFDGVRLLAGKANPAALALYEQLSFSRCGEAALYGSDFYCYRLAFPRGLSSGPDSSSSCP